MKIISITSLFLATVTATPAPEVHKKRDPGWEAPFNAITMRVMKQNPPREEYLQAYKSRFWIGGMPSTWYPDGQGPGIDETVLQGGRIDSLSVSVEGGQHLYIDPDGALRYTTPSNPEPPPGSYMGDMNYAFDWVFVPNQPGTWWWACPNPEERDSYCQLFAPFENITVPGVNDPTILCYKADVAGFEYKGKTPVTYMYT
ncbi:hypothetical protein FQN49_007838 [Arthroderma sp. PD_2]|nr:hypothetical protein FQN49_007838 [Arthroderma sp. PD_2]